MGHAYDYEQQRWIRGRAGAQLRVEQISEELELLTTDSGYRAFVGLEDDAEYRAALVALDAEATALLRELGVRP